MSNELGNRLLLRKLIRNWVSLAGAVIAVGSFFAFLLLFALDMLSEHGNPYMGILAYMVAPGFLFLGIALIVLGFWLHRRQERRVKPDAPPVALTIDLSRPRDRKILWVFIVGSVVFLFMTALGSYQTYQYTESVQFCGRACHVPMDPQFVTSQHSAHARVDCVACHVGSGASAYLKTKISGMRQLYHVAMGDFPRPIRVDSTKLRPARETCEKCHWPEKFTGGFERMYRHYLSDEKNTPFSVRLLLKVGGNNPLHGPPDGIHWHVSTSNKVEFITTDDMQLDIPWVRQTSADGKVTEYRNPDFKGDLSKFPVHTMDCIDCHNRPSHKFHPPNDAVDLSIASGRVDRSIPWVKQKMVAALAAPYATREEAMQKIESSLRADFPDNPKVADVIAETKSIYNANFFPEMKADWRAYPDHIGHKIWEGCFRCHDGKHKTVDGKSSIQGNNCNSCHLILAQGNDEEMNKLNAKGYEFIHVDSEYSDFSCAECHTGAAPKE
ncbi:MAG: NapC/NirT family cytochrome c [Verrucomicrobiota bacterium]